MQSKPKKSFVGKFQMLDCNLKFQSLKISNMVIKKKNLRVKSWLNSIVCMVSTLQKSKKNSHSTSYVKSWILHLMNFFHNTKTWHFMTNFIWWQQHPLYEIFDFRFHEIFTNIKTWHPGLVLCDHNGIHDFFLKKTHKWWVRFDYSWKWPVVKIMFWCCAWILQLSYLLWRWRKERRRSEEGGVHLQNQSPLDYGKKSQNSNPSNPRKISPDTLITCPPYIHSIYLYK